MAIRFLYFDLGNVLLTFSHQLAAEQMADVAGVSSEQVWQLVFAGDLQRRYETGEISDQQFYEAFCTALNVRPGFKDVQRAASQIFEINMPIVPLVSQLAAAGHRLGILSNTCSAHWLHCREDTYSILGRLFPVCALSYELGVCKPDPRIFQRAAELAGVAPHEIFFTDDIPAHIAAAREAGWQAAPFTTVATLAADLRSLGVHCNY